MTLPAATPGTAEQHPRPPSGFSSMNAPACVAILPAIPRSSVRAAAGGPDRRSRSRRAGRTRVDQPLSQLGVGREVQVGEQRVPVLEHRDLGPLRPLALTIASEPEKTARASAMISAQLIMK